MTKSTTIAETVECKQAHYITIGPSPYFPHSGPYRVHRLIVSSRPHRNEFNFSNIRLKSYTNIFGDKLFNGVIIISSNSVSVNTYMGTQSVERR